jgi:hypothetical protein
VFHRDPSVWEPLAPFEYRRDEESRRHGKRGARQSA